MKDWDGSGYSGYAAFRSLQSGNLHLMDIHKKILEWQAAHPHVTWIGWGIVWMVVFVILFWPRKSG